MLSRDLKIFSLCAYQNVSSAEGIFYCEPIKYLEAVISSLTNPL